MNPKASPKNAGKGSFTLYLFAQHFGCFHFQGSSSKSDKTKFKARSYETMHSPDSLRNERS